MEILIVFDTNKGDVSICGDSNLTYPDVTTAEAEKLKKVSSKSSGNIEDNL